MDRYENTGPVEVEQQDARLDLDAALASADLLRMTADAVLPDGGGLHWPAPPVTIYFTFGYGSRLRNRFVKIVAPTRAEAREIMCEIFDYNWSREYDADQWRSRQDPTKTQVEEYGLTELVLDLAPLPGEPGPT